MLSYALPIYLAICSIPDQVEKWHKPAFSEWSFQHMEELFPTDKIDRGEEETFPLDENLQDIGEISFRNLSGFKKTIKRMLKDTDTDAFLVLKDGEIAYERYFNETTKETPHILFSCSKSILGTLAGILIERGELDRDEFVLTYVPELAESGFGDATVQELMDMLVAINCSDLDESTHGKFYQAIGYSPQEHPETFSLTEYLPTIRKKGNHGKKFNYATPNANVLVWVIENATGRNIASLISDEIWSKLGCEQDAYVVVDRIGNAHMGGGFNCTARDLARFGQMILQNGCYNGEQIVSPEWIVDTVTEGNKKAFRQAVEHYYLPNGSYRNFWWNMGDDHGTLMTSGSYGQHLFIDPVANVVIVKFSHLPKARDVWKKAQHFLGFWAIVEATN